MGIKNQTFYQGSTSCSRILSNMQRQQSEQNHLTQANMFPNINYKEYGRFHNVMPLNLPLPKSISMPKPYPSKPLPAWPTIFRRPLPFLFNNQSACPATFRLPVPLTSTPRAFTQRRFLSRKVFFQKLIYIFLKICDYFHYFLS